MTRTRPIRRGSKTNALLAEATTGTRHGVFCWMVHETPTDTVVLAIDKVGHDHIAKVVRVGTNSETELLREIARPNTVVGAAKRLLSWFRVANSR